jgi:hypothetical protein
MKPDRIPIGEEANWLPSIRNLLHSFTSDIACHIEGVPDEDGLLQAIRPAQKRFRKSIRMTAPNFRPFEQKYENRRHRGRALFLSSEEGEDGEDEASESEEDEDEEDEASEREDCTETFAQPSKKRKQVANKIYIDEVMDRAQRLVFHMFHHRNLRIMLNFAVALAPLPMLRLTFEVSILFVYFITMQLKFSKVGFKLSHYLRVCFSVHCRRNCMVHSSLWQPPLHRRSTRRSSQR